MTTTQQPEALVFADDRPTSTSDDLYQWAIDAEDLIRAQHARIEELEAQLSAIGAGGVEPLRKRASTADVDDERKAFEAWAEYPRLWGLPHKEAQWAAWKARAALSATPAVALPEPEAWLATFRPKGMLSPHSIAGVNLEELKRQVPSDSVFKPLYTRHASQELAQFIEQVGDVHFQRCRIGSKEGAIRWDIEFGHYGDKVCGKTLREAITKAIAAQAKQGGAA